eukprot:TRINITY_DN13856_c0_g1_i3.p1 TRINITY_DN13856_c0_g1~~TRINITY_DN13856_c0_g1_i3.p1  ORF type:complete len:707 (+),score=151.25 TRINITY_DN13856_c0_g1_i3:75-2123(+)
MREGAESSNYEIEVFTSPVPEPVALELIAFLQAAPDGCGETASADLAQRLCSAGGGGLWAVCREGGRVAAHLSISYDPAQKQPVGLLCCVLTHPNHRRRGLAKVCLREALAQFDRAGGAAVVACVPDMAGAALCTPFNFDLVNGTLGGSAVLLRCPAPTALWGRDLALGDGVGPAACSAPRGYDCRPLRRTDWASAVLLLNAALGENKMIPLGIGSGETAALGLLHAFESQDRGLLRMACSVERRTGRLFALAVTVGGAEAVGYAAPGEEQLAGGGGEALSAVLDFLRQTTLGRGPPVHGCVRARPLTGAERTQATALPFGVAEATAAPAPGGSAAFSGSPFGAAPPHNSRSAPAGGVDRSGVRGSGGSWASSQGRGSLGRAKTELHYPLEPSNPLASRPDLVAQQVQLRGVPEESYVDGAIVSSMIEGTFIMLRDKGAPGRERRSDLQGQSLKLLEVHMTRMKHKRPSEEGRCDAGECETSSAPGTGGHRDQGTSDRLHVRALLDNPMNAATVRQLEYHCKRRRGKLRNHFHGFKIQTTRLLDDDRDCASGKGHRGQRAGPSGLSRHTLPGPPTAAAGGVSGGGAAFAGRGGDVGCRSGFGYKGSKGHQACGVGMGGGPAYLQQGAWVQPQQGVLGASPFAAAPQQQTWGGWQAAAPPQPFQAFGWATQHAGLGQAYPFAR